MLSSIIQTLFTDKAINSIFKSPENVFVKAKAMDLMFRGLPIDCSVTDTAGSAVCSLLKANTDDLIVDDPDHFRFALLGAVCITQFQYLY